MTGQPNYPHPDGDIIALGPEIFASPDGEVISWKGDNYIRQNEPTRTEAALIHNDWPAGTRWLHIEFTSPDEMSANTSALALADHLRAEFPGVGMRISSNAVETESVIVCTTACDEQHLYDWTCEQFAGISDEPPRTTPDNSPTSGDEADNPTATEATSLRERLARALAGHAGSKAFLADGSEWDHMRTAWYAHADAALAELSRELAALAEYENAITWHTDCLSCARILDSCIRETERAEQAESALRAILNAADAPTHCHEHPTTWDGGGPCTYCTALAAARATLAEPRPEPGVHVYLSTGCWHGDHDYCKSMTGLGGAKRPASCKKCGVRCICPCHQQTEPPVHIGGQANAEDCPACKGTNPDYPFICPGPDAEQPARTTADNPAGKEQL